MTSNEISITINAGGLVVNFVVLVFLLVQVRLLGNQVDHAKEVYVLEQKRVRKQATLDFLTSTTDKRNDLYGRLPHESDVIAVNQFLDTVDNNQDSLNLLNEYLNQWELLATAVNTEILDIEIVEKMCGFTIMRVEDTYREFTERARLKRKHKTLFGDLEKLAAELRSKVNYQPDRFVRTKS